MFTRPIFKKTFTSFNNFQQRYMSGGSHSYEQLRKDTLIWRFASFRAGGFIVLPFAVWTFATLTHEHSEDGLVYQQIRNRPYPWKECSNCDFFNTDCWNDCRAQARGIKSNSGHH